MHGKKINMSDVPKSVNGYPNEVGRKIELQTVTAKLAVRELQYTIAIEGLKTIIESNDPMGIAKETISAMEECIP